VRAAGGDAPGWHHRDAVCGPATTFLVLEYRDEHHAVDVVSPNRPTAGTLDITKEAPKTMAVETIPVRSGVRFRRGARVAALFTKP
jgi:hypothetical protein